MDLDQLNGLPPVDRWVFVRGRIVTEAVAMDAALRGVHAALRDRHDRDALLEAPEGWGSLLRECGDRMSSVGDEIMRSAISAALTDTAAAWDDRNRYMHDLLVEHIDIEDAPPDVKSEPRSEDDRYRLRLARKKNFPESESVSLDHAIALVCSLVAATWRLRAARNYLANGSATWRGMLVGHVEGGWDGNADWITADEDDD